MTSHYDDDKIVGNSGAVVIIGVGSVALRAAIEAHDAGLGYLLLARPEKRIRTHLARGDKIAAFAVKF